MLLLRDDDIIKENSLQTNFLRYSQENDVLQFLIDNAIIDSSNVQNSLKAMKRKELLEKHAYEVWEGKDGKWYTYLPSQKGGRTLKSEKQEKI